jgi:flagella basal body P-ring formation protein FlgA
MMLKRVVSKTLLVAVAAFLAVVSAAPAEAGDVMRTILVPRAVIYPGDVISADALIERKIQRDDTSPATFGESADDVVGKVARRTLLPGELIPSSAVRRQDAVTQGRRYKIKYESESLSIVGVVVALKSGAVGDTIQVRNPDSGVIINARVEPDQTLAVDDK